MLMWLESGQLLVAEFSLFSQGLWSERNVVMKWKPLPRAGGWAVHKAWWIATCCPHTLNIMNQWQHTWERAWLSSREGIEMAEGKPWSYDIVTTQHDQPSYWRLALCSLPNAEHGDREPCYSW
jgi:hypothetical protein